MIEYKLRVIAKESAIYAQKLVNELIKEPLDSDDTQRIADVFRQELDIFNGNV